MKVTVTRTYVVDVPNSAYEELSQEFLEMEYEYTADGQYENVEDVAKGVGLWLVEESYGGNYTQYVEETNTTYELNEL